MMQNHLSNCSLNSDLEDSLDTIDYQDHDHPHDPLPPSPPKLSDIQQRTPHSMDSSSEDDDSCGFSPISWVDGTVSVKWMDEDDWRTGNSVMYLPGRVTPGLLAAAFQRRSSHEIVRKEHKKMTKVIKKQLESSRDAAGASSTSDERAKTTGELRIPSPGKAGAMWRASSAERKVLKHKAKTVGDSEMSTSTSSGELVSNKESQLGMGLCGGKLKFRKPMYSNLTDELLSNSENNAAFGAYPVRDIDRFDDTLALTEGAISYEELRRSPVAPDVTNVPNAHADENFTNSISDDDRSALIADGPETLRGDTGMDGGGKASMVDVFLTTPKHSFYSEEPLALGPDCPSEFDSDMHLADDRMDDLEAPKSYYDAIFAGGNNKEKNGMGFDAYEDDRSDGGLRRRDVGFERNLREVDLFVRDSLHPDLKAAAVHSDAVAFPDQEEVAKQYLASCMPAEDDETLNYPVHGHHVHHDAVADAVPHEEVCKSMDLTLNDREASGSALLSVPASEVETKALTMQDIDGLLSDVKAAKERAELKLENASSRSKQHTCEPPSLKKAPARASNPWRAFRSYSEQQVERSDSEMMKSSDLNGKRGADVVGSDMSIAVLKLDELDQLLRAVGKAAAAMERADSIPDAVRRLNEKFDALASEMEILPREMKEAGTAMSVSRLALAKPKVVLVKETSAGPMSQSVPLEDKVEFKETGTDVKTVEKADFGVMKGQSLISFDNDASEPAKNQRLEQSAILSDIITPFTSDDLLTAMPTENPSRQKTAPSTPVEKATSPIPTSNLLSNLEEKATSPGSAGITSCQSIEENSPAEPISSKADTTPLVQELEQKNETINAVGALREAVENLREIEKQTTHFLEHAYKQLAEATVVMTPSVPSTPTAGIQRRIKTELTTYSKPSPTARQAVLPHAHQCRGSPTTQQSAPFDRFRDPVDSSIEAATGAMSGIPIRNCCNHEHRVRFNHPVHQVCSGEVSPISNSKLRPLSRVKRGPHGAGIFGLNQSAMSNPYADSPETQEDSDQGSPRHYENDPFPLNEGKNVDGIALPPLRIHSAGSTGGSAARPGEESRDSQPASILRSSSQRIDKFPLEEGMNVKIVSPAHQSSRMRPLKLTLRTRGAGAASATAQQAHRGGIQGPSMLSPSSVSPQKSSRSSPTKTKYEAVLERSKKMYDVHYKRGVRFLRQHEKQMAATASKLGQGKEENLVLEGAPDLGDDMMSYGFNAERPSFFDPGNMFDAQSRKLKRTSPQAAASPGFYSDRGRKKLGSTDSALNLLHSAGLSSESYDTLVSLKSPTKSAKPGILRRRQSSKTVRRPTMSARPSSSRMTVRRRRSTWVDRISSLLESEDGSRLARTLTVTALAIPLAFIAVQEMGRIGSSSSSAGAAAGQVASWTVASSQDVARY